LQKLDACEVVNLSSIQRCTNAMRMLAYGLVANTFNEYYRVEKNTTIECLNVKVV